MTNLIPLLPSKPIFKAFSCIAKKLHDDTIFIFRVYYEWLGCCPKPVRYLPCFGVGFRHDIYDRTSHNRSRHNSVVSSRAIIHNTIIHNAASSSYHFLHSLYHIARRLHFAVKRIKTIYTSF